MISGHGSNPIFFHKKLKIGRTEHPLIPHSLRLKTSHFCLTTPPPTPPLKVDVIYVSPLSLTSIDEKKTGGSKNPATTSIELCVAKLLDFHLKRNKRI